MGRNALDFYGYKVDPDGTVYNKDGSIKKFSDNGRGYPISRFSTPEGWKTLAQHTVVANVYLRERPEGYEVNHKDNNKWNNCVSNLEYVSKSENRLQMYRDGRDVKGSKNANAKHTEEDIEELCTRLEEGSYKNMSTLSQELGISKTTISLVKRKKQWVSVSKNYAI